jgi:hypothetical protein
MPRCRRNKRGGSSEPKKTNCLLHWSCNTHNGAHLLKLGWWLARSFWICRDGQCYSTRGEYLQKMTNNESWRYVFCAALFHCWYSKCIRSLMYTIRERVKLWETWMVPFIMSLLRVVFDSNGCSQLIPKQGRGRRQINELIRFCFPHMKWSPTHLVYV